MSLIDLDELERLNHRAFHWQVVVGAHSVERVEKATIAALIAELRAARKVVDYHKIALRLITDLCNTRKWGATKATLHALNAAIEDVTRRALADYEASQK